MSKCEKCGSKALVAETRRLELYTRRRLRCGNALCKNGWATYELHEAEYQKLSKAYNQLLEVEEVIGHRTSKLQIKRVGGSNLHVRRAEFLKLHARVSPRSAGANQKD